MPRASSYLLYKNILKISFQPKCCASIINHQNVRELNSKIPTERIPTPEKVGI